MGVIDHTDVVVIVLYYYLTKGHPCVKYFLVLFQLACPIGQIGTSFSEVVLYVHIHCYTISELEGIVFQFGSLLHHLAFNSSARKFNNDWPRFSGVSAESLLGLREAGGRPTRWVTSKSSMTSGGCRPILLLNRDIALVSVFPSVSSGIPNIRMEDFLPCCSRSSCWISMSATFFERAEIVASFQPFEIFIEIFLH